MTHDPGQTQTAPKKRKGRRVLMWWAGSFAALVLSAELFSVFAMGVHLSGQEAPPYMRSVAHQFKAKPEWKLVSDHETLQYDRHACLVPACPVLEQKWDLGMEPVSCDGLHQLLTDSGYRVIVRRSNYTPEANEQAENCTRVMNAVSSDAEAAWGLVRIEAIVYPPSVRKGSEREHYELLLRVIK
ncbi:hypothetical protein ACLH0K_09930 [Arthrobacter sp. MPF02]|uniref:hypothetical protein n=1 Tax=Arthrobacter sp. MPF02 TaxID=3388492 RepID=UPI0039851C13